MTGLLINAFPTAIVYTYDSSWGISPSFYDRLDRPAYSMMVALEPPRHDTYSFVVWQLSGHIIFSTKVVAPAEEAVRLFSTAYFNLGLDSDYKPVL